MTNVLPSVPFAVSAPVPDFSPPWNPSGMLSYGNVYNPNPSNSGSGGMSTSSPMVSGLAYAYVSRLRDAQYQREVLQPYQQYI